MRKLQLHNVASLTTFAIRNSLTGSRANTLPHFAAPLT
jgi:hypothetical protein